MGIFFDTRNCPDLMDCLSSFSTISAPVRYGLRVGFVKIGSSSIYILPVLAALRLLKLSHLAFFPAWLCRPCLPLLSRPGRV